MHNEATMPSSKVEQEVLAIELIDKAAPFTPCFD
jgi:hypothetical protein